MTALERLLNTGKHLEACEDYIRQISGKTLVFHAYTDHRTEVTFI